MDREYGDSEAQSLDIASVSSNVPEAYIKDMRRVRDSVPWRLWIVAAIAFCERAAFWGLTAPWQNYMEHPPDYAEEETPGALGLGQAMATRIYCSFYIFYYVIPIFVAVVADGRLGQYKTLLASIVLYCLGIVALLVSSMPANLAKGWGMPGLIISMVLIGLGGGGVKAILPPFIADQYTEIEPKVKTLGTGEQVVTDYELTLQYICNLYYWIGNVGSLSWFGTVFIERHYGFTPAYGLTLGLMVIALLILIFGERWLVQGSHEDNAILSQASKIITCALKHGCRMKCATPEYQLQHRQKTITWSQGMVEELSRGLRCCRVLLSFIAFYVCFDQMQNNLISQAGQMNTHGVPNDLLPALNQVGCILMGPIIQLGLYPLLHRRRIYIGPIMRITIGFGFVAASMLYATFVQYAVYTSSPCISNPSDCSSLTSGNSGPNVWLQAPIYFLISTGEIFGLVTGLEYAYDHSPKGMKVIVQAVNLLIAGVGSVIALSLTAVAHDPNLIIFYGSLSGSMGATTVIFWLLFRKYDRIERLSNKPEPLLRRSADIETGAQGPYTNKSSPSMPSSSIITLVAHEAVDGIEMTRLRSTSDTTLVHTGPKDISVHV